MAVRVLQGHVIDVLAREPERSVHTCVTSPPYWGLRSYGTPPQVWGAAEGCEHEWGAEGSVSRRGANAGASAQVGNTVARVCPPVIGQGAFCQRCGAWRGELGQEPTPDLYVAHMVDVFRAVKRVLRDDGSLWINLGDAYVATGGGGESRMIELGRPSDNAIHAHAGNGQLSGRTGRGGLPTGNLVGIPWRVAFAMQADGWMLRSAITWIKTSPMPESIQGTRWERCRVRVGAGPKDLGRYGGEANAFRGTAGAQGAHVGGTGPVIDGSAEWADCPGCPKCAANEGLVLRRGSGRPTSGSEMIFIFVKKMGSYYWDSEAGRHFQHLSDTRRMVQLDDGSPVPPGVRGVPADLADDSVLLPQGRLRDQDVQGLRDCQSPSVPSVTGGSSQASGLRATARSEGQSRGECEPLLPREHGRGQGAGEGEAFDGRGQGTTPSLWGAAPSTAGCEGAAPGLRTIGSGEGGNRLRLALDAAEAGDLPPVPSERSRQGVPGSLSEVGESQGGVAPGRSQAAGTDRGPGRSGGDSDGSRVGGDQGGRWARLPLLREDGPAADPGPRHPARTGRAAHQGEHRPGVPDVQLPQGEQALGTRNLLNYQSFPSEPSKLEHYAGFPTGVPRLAISCGTSARGVCPTCGAPHARIVERRSLERYELPTDHEHYRPGRYPTKQGGEPGTDNGQRVSESTTIGWRQTCACPAHQPVPATVMDCFGGSGTTGMVADRLGRNAVLVELKPDYAAMAKRRLTADAPLFADVSLEGAAG